MTGFLGPFSNFPPGMNEIDDYTEEENIWISFINQPNSEILEFIMNNFYEEIPDILLRDFDDIVYNFFVSDDDDSNGIKKADEFWDQSPEKIIENLIEILGNSNTIVNSLVYHLENEICDILFNKKE